MSKSPAQVEPKTPRKLPRFRFSLRTLLIVNTLLSIGFGLFFSRVQNERWAAKAIAEANGIIVYDWQVRPAGSDSKFKPTPPGPKWLRKHLGAHWLDRIVEVSLNGYGNRSKKNRFSEVGPHLTKLRALRSLTLWGGKLDHAGYQLLGRLTQLEKLHLRLKSEIGQQSAVAIARVTSLRELSLDKARISPEALQELAKLPNLESLDIDCGYLDLSTGVTITRHQLHDEAAKAIATFPKLRKLMLFATQITDEGMAALCQLSQLKTLVVSSPNITSASFDQVNKLRHMEHLGTWGWQIEDADFEKLSQLPNLNSLGLTSTNLTDESVACLTKLDQIERLTLDGEKITDASLYHFYRLSKLKWLNLKHTSVSKYGPAAKALQKAYPNCIFNLPPTEKEKEISRAFHRQKWNLGNNTPIQLTPNQLKVLTKKVEPSK